MYLETSAYIVWTVYADLISGSLYPFSQIIKPSALFQFYRKKPSYHGVVSRKMYEEIIAEPSRYQRGIMLVH